MSASGGGAPAERMPSTQARGLESFKAALEDASHQPGATLPART